MPAIEIASRGPRIISLAALVSASVHRLPFRSRVWEGGLEIIAFAALCATRSYSFSYRRGDFSLSTTWQDSAEDSHIRGCLDVRCTRGSHRRCNQRFLISRRDCYMPRKYLPRFLSLRKNSLQRLIIPRTPPKHTWDPGAYVITFSRKKEKWSTEKTWATPEPDSWNSKTEFEHFFYNTVYVRWDKLMYANLVISYNRRDINNSYFARGKK